MKVLWRNIRMKVAIDAGHGGADLGTIYGERYEKDDNLRLAMEVGRQLENAGAEVYQTRTEDFYHSPIERAGRINDSNSDVAIILHRNDSITPNTYSGVEAFIHSAGGEKGRIAERILSNLEMIGLINLGVNAMANDSMLKRLQMPAILLEIGFINTEEDNQFFDSYLENIAAAIVDGIVTESYEMNENYPYTYRVRVGGVTNEMLARRMAYRLFLDGYQAVIKPMNNQFVVQVGEIYQLDQAVMLEQYLRMLGYSTFIIVEEYDSFLQNPRLT